MTNQLRIHLLGDLQPWRDGQMVLPDAWPSRKACQLFKLLATHRHQTVSSDELIEWLWPDFSPESARNSLWVAISRLRRVLEPEETGRGASTFILTSPTTSPRAASATSSMVCPAFGAYQYTGTGSTRVNGINQNCTCHLSQEVDLREMPGCPLNTGRIPNWCHLPRRARRARRDLQLTAMSTETLRKQANAPR